MGAGEIDLLGNIADRLSSIDSKLDSLIDLFRDARNDNSVLEETSETDIAQEFNGDPKETLMKLVPKNRAMSISYNVKTTESNTNNCEGYSIWCPVIYSQIINVAIKEDFTVPTGYSLVITVNLLADVDLQPDQVTHDDYRTLVITVKNITTDLLLDEDTSVSRLATLFYRLYSPKYTKDLISNSDYEYCLDIDNIDNTRFKFTLNKEYNLPDGLKEEYIDSVVIEDDRSISMYQDRITVEIK